LVHERLDCNELWFAYIFHQCPLIGKYSLQYCNSGRCTLAGRFCLGLVCGGINIPHLFDLMSSALTITLGQKYPVSILCLFFHLQYGQRWFFMVLLWLVFYSNHSANFNDILQFQIYISFPMY